jgi:hypothetical protein
MLTLAPDQPQSVELSGDDNLVRLVRTRVESDRLVVDLPPNTHFHEKLPLSVRVSATALTRVEASDSASVKVDRVEGDAVLLSAHDASGIELDAVHASHTLSIAASDSGNVQIASGSADADVSIRASDASNVSASDMNVTGRLSIHASDASTVVLHGQAAGLTAELSDASHCDAEAFSADDVVLDESDGCTASVCAKGSLSMKLTDSSRATYHCDPASVTQDIHDGSAAERG